jgi:Flp pilus assembly protein TadB
MNKSSDEDSLFGVMIMSFMCAMGIGFIALNYVSLTFSIGIFLISFVLICIFYAVVYGRFK